MVKPLLILLVMANSNHPHIHKLRFTVIMVDDHISMSMPQMMGTIRLKNSLSVTVHLQEFIVLRLNK